MANLEVRDYLDRRLQRNDAPLYLPPYPWMGGRKRKQTPETLAQIEKRVNHAIIDWEYTQCLGRRKDKRLPVYIMPLFRFPPTMATDTYYWPHDHWMDWFGDLSAYRALQQDPNVKWCFQEDVQREIEATGTVFEPTNVLKEIMSPKSSSSS